MPSFDSFDGASLVYTDEGDGRVVLLLHGFAADTNVNYVRSGILDALLDEGYRVVALDLRGHGLSDKPTDVEGYADDAMKRDVLVLLDRLGVDDLLLIGYSMGADLALRVTGADPRVKALVLLGIGEQDDDPDWRDSLVAMLESDGPGDDVDDATMAEFRVMAGLDRAPLIAYLKSVDVSSSRPVEGVDVPVLLVVGEDDVKALDPERLAARLGGEFVSVRGDHFTANSSPALHQALIGFLRAQ